MAARVGACLQPSRHHVRLGLCMATPVHICSSLQSLSTSHLCSCAWLLPCTAVATHTYPYLLNVATPMYRRDDRPRHRPDRQLDLSVSSTCRLARPPSQLDLPLSMHFSSTYLRRRLVHTSQSSPSQTFTSSPVTAQNARCCGKASALQHPLNGKMPVVQIAA